MSDLDDLRALRRKVLIYSAKVLFDEDLTYKEKTATLRRVALVLKALDNLIRASQEK